MVDIYKKIILISPFQGVVLDISMDAQNMEMNRPIHLHSLLYHIKIGDKDMVGFHKKVNATTYHKSYYQVVHGDLIRLWVQIIPLLTFLKFLVQKY